MTASISLQWGYFNRQKFRVMPLTTSSADAIIYSMLLTKSAVTGCYEAHPDALRNKISTQQSTWMEMENGSNAAVALKDCGGAAALGGGIGSSYRLQLRRWAAAVAAENMQQWCWCQHC
jgi:hypothetical protein